MPSATAPVGTGSLSGFVNAFKTGQRLAHPVPGIAGRIIRGKNPSDFETLTDDPQRQIVLILGPDDLAKLPGMSGWDILMTIGYDPAYARGKVAEGCEFKLVVLQEGPSVKLATWDNLLEMVCEVYPNVADLIRSHWTSLKTRSFREIEAQAGFKFLEVEQPKDKTKKKQDDPRFMTYERLQQSSGTLADVRAFLYFSVHIRELYRGDGYTDVSGSRGMREYLARNVRLVDLGAHELIDFEVTCPPEAPAVHTKTGGSAMSTALTTHDTLGFLDPTLAHGPYRPNLELARKMGLLARKQGVRPAQKLIAAGKSRLAIVIDGETDFADDGRLPVKGTYADTWRMCQRIYKGTMEGHYTGILLTIDQHPAITVHSEVYWEDEQGNPPDVTLPVMMFLDDAKARFPFLATFIDGSPKRRYRPRYNPKFTVEQYAPHLLNTGQGPIWVFKSHCRMGTDGIQLIAPLAELVEFMAVALEIEPVFMAKGHIAQVDWFGPFRPCMDVPTHPQGGLQTQYLDLIRAANNTDIFGEAEDFCVRNGMKQVLEYYGNDRPVLERIAFVGDCTSPIIADDPKAGPGKMPNADFRREMASKGVKIITHDTPFTV